MTEYRLNALGRHIFSPMIEKAIIERRRRLSQFIAGLIVPMFVVGIVSGMVKNLKVFEEDDR